MISGFSGDIPAAALRHHKVWRVFVKPWDVLEFVDAVDALRTKRRGA